MATLIVLVSLGLTRSHGLDSLSNKNLLLAWPVSLSGQASTWKIPGLYREAACPYKHNYPPLTFEEFSMKSISWSCFAVRLAQWYTVPTCINFVKFQCCILKCTWTTVNHQGLEYNFQHGKRDQTVKWEKLTWMQWRHSRMQRKTGRSPPNW